MKKNGFIEYSPEVKKALEKNKPVAALETAALCRGMAYPQNFETAKKLMELVSDEGAVPAAVAVIGGKIKIGLSRDELEYICRAGADIKAADRRDLPVLAAAGEDGAAALSATVFAAKLAGIKAAAAGGIWAGADTVELAKSGVLLISGGPAALPEAGAVLDTLAGLGVPVLAVGTDAAPAQYVRDSGFKADHRVNSAAELAKAFRAHRELGGAWGMLALNPLPEAYAIERTALERGVELAMEKAKQLGIRGRELPAFLQALIKEMTGGKSVEAEVATLCANARLAAQTAVVLSAIMDDDEAGGFDPELIKFIRKEIAEDVSDELEDEMEEELEEAVNKEMKKAREELRTEVTEMLAAYALTGRPAAPAEPAEPAKPEKPAKPAHVIPAEYAADPERAMPEAGEDGGPVLDDRPFVPFVPGQKNEQHGPAPKAEPEPEPEHEEEAPAKPTQEDEHEAEEAAEPEAEAEHADEHGDGAEETPAEETPAEDEFTVYDPNAYRAKREAEKQNRADADEPPTNAAGMTEYDPDAYRQRAKEKKRRMAMASGEPIPEDVKTDADREAEAAALVDCKGPLEFTGEHPLAWKCTRCGQLFEKHEIPHKRPKTPED